MAIMLIAHVKGHLSGNGVSTAAVTLLSNGELPKWLERERLSAVEKFVTYLDTLALGQGDPGLLLANDKHVRLTSSESVVDGILDVDNVETTIVTLTVSDDTNTTHVTTTSDHADNAAIEADEVNNLAGGNVNLDGVVDTDGGVGVTDAEDRILAKPCSVSMGSYCCQNRNRKIFHVLRRSTKAWSND